ncbi:MAG: BatA domain-containing protein [Planctomycetaceae bacterium]|nr:BatA domain-containing protein [Planctomycetaceae bacterium]
MTFLTVGLIFGGVTAASIPVALHLMMQGQPKAFEFPALRFIQRRLVINRRRFRLKYLILLALRVLVFVLLGFALARPTFRLMSAGNFGSQEVPIAAVIVVDTSLRMNYLSANKTRLEEAKELANWLLGQFPKNSQVAVIGSQRLPASFQVDLLAAKDRIKRLSTVSAGRPLLESLLEGVKLLQQSELERREIYLITDMSEPGWPESLRTSAKLILADVPEAALYLLDVGVPEPADTALTKVTLSDQVISSETALQIDVELTHVGPQESRVVEIFLKDAASIFADRLPQESEEKSPEINSGANWGEKRGTVTVDFPQGASKRNITFRLSGLAEGINQGVIRLTTSDALDINDRIYFTVNVQPPSRLLIASPSGREAMFLQQALAPSSLKRSGIVPFLIETTTLAELETFQVEDLSKYRAIFLPDPPPLSSVCWKKLADYAAAGNGIALFLGRNAEPVSEFNIAAARELLGMTFQGQVQIADGDVWLAPDSFQHPALAPFREESLNEIPWHVLPVFRYWAVDNLAHGTDIVIPYSDGRPAMMTRPIGQGNVLVMTTPVSDLPNDDPWNLLPTSVEAPWVFLMLCDGVAQFLTGTGEKNYNYLSGQLVTLRFEMPQFSASFPTSSVVTPPTGNGIRVTTDTVRKTITFPAGDPLGNYIVSAGGTGGGGNANGLSTSGSSGRLQSGFSVNAPPNEWNLTRMTPERLREIFGDRLQIINDRAKLEVGMSRVRVGRELFPGILLLLAIFFSAEYLLANRFS